MFSMASSYPCYDIISKFRVRSIVGRETSLLDFLKTGETSR